MLPIDFGEHSRYPMHSYEKKVVSGMPDIHFTNSIREIENIVGS